MSHYPHPLSLRPKGAGAIGRYLLFVAVLLILLPHVAFADTQKEEEDGWGEPEVEKAQTARDEEARRRLMELETWLRKFEAEKAKKEQEEAGKIKFELSGKYKLRLNARDNLHLNNPAQKWPYDESTYFDQRFQLKIDAEYGPLSMMVLFDKGNFVFDWKEGSEGGLDRWSEFLTANAPFARELYFQYTGSFVVKAGRQSIILGTGGGIAIEGPVDSVKIAYPLGKTAFGRVTLTLAYIALGGGVGYYDPIFAPRQPLSGNRAWGDRRYVMGFENKMDALLFSLDIRPGRYLTIEPYFLMVNDRGEDPMMNPDLNLDKDFNASTTPRDGEFEPMWIGVAISGKGKKISYTADMIYLTGSYTENRDLSAYAALLRGDYHFDGGFSTGLEFGMGSGNKVDDTDADDFKDFMALFMCKDRRKFGNIFSEDLRAGYFFWDSNLANVTFARAIVELEPVEKLKATISVVKLWTTESVYKGRGPVGDWSLGGSASTEETNDIGWEVDLDLLFPIYKKFLYGFAELGYFTPGDAYQLPDGQDADPATEIVIGAEFVF